MATRPPPCAYVFDGETCDRRGDHRCKGRVGHVLAFFAELLVHTKGDYAGAPFIPSTWQRERVLAPLFGRVTYDTKRARYVRQYRLLYLCVARKNGKSELLAGMMLYLLCADGEQGAELYGLALDRDQAGQVYRVASRMVVLNPALAGRLQVIPSSKRIVDEHTASFYGVVAGDALGALGSNPSAAYIDELLTQPSRDLYDAIRTGMGTRAQPMLLLATTAENNPEGFAATERAWSLKVMADPGLEPTRLVVIYTAPVEADWTQRATWKLANPALGDFLDEKVLADECQHAVNNPAAERSFRQFRLNQPVGQTGRAIPLPAWDASVGEVPYPQLAATLLGRECFAGLDLASTSDLASYALDFPNQDGSHTIMWRHFCPTNAVEQLDRRTGGRASVWAAEGLLSVTDGNVIDYSSIRLALDEDRDRYRITEVGFDRWGATQLASELLDEGYPLIQVGQGFAAMSPPTVELLRLIAGGLYHHGGNPLVRWQATNLVTRSDPAGNLKPDKARSVEKIDGIVAGIMALDRACRHVVPDAKRFAAAGF